MVFGILLLIAIFILWKLFVDGWLFKIILFIAGWFGLYVALRVYTPEAAHTAITLGNGVQLSWAFIVPCVICFLCLLCTKVNND